MKQNKKSVAKAAEKVRKVGGEKKSWVNAGLLVVAMMTLVSGVCVFVAKMRANALGDDVSVVVESDCAGNDCPLILDLEAEAIGAGMALPQNQDGSFQSNASNAELLVRMEFVSHLMIMQTMPGQSPVTIYDQDNLGIGASAQAITVPVSQLAIGRNEFAVRAYNANGDLVEAMVTIVYQPGSAEFPLSGSAGVLNPDGSPATAYDGGSGGPAKDNTYAVIAPNPILGVTGENVTRVVVSNANSGGVSTLLDQTYEDPTDLNNLQYSLPAGSLKPGLNTITITFYGVGGQEIVRTYYIYYFPDGIPLPPNTGYLTFGKLSISKTDFGISIGLVIVAAALLGLLALKNRRKSVRR